VLVRPSYVLGGRAMEIVYDERSLESFVERAFVAMPDSPVLIDRFLEDAFEFDVDALADGEEAYIAGIMQHVEEAGVHSGDSECLLPPYQITRRSKNSWCARPAPWPGRFGSGGSSTCSSRSWDGIVYVLEANPRASRTVPFVSKATGLPLARLATDLALGARLRDLDLPPEGEIHGHAVKKPVFPFDKFPDASIYLGPEMRSTGEIMAWAPSVGQATEKAWIAAGHRLPLSGHAYISLNDRDKRRAGEIGRAFRDLGFELLATRGTAAALAAAGLEVHRVLQQGQRRPAGHRRRHRRRPSAAHRQHAARARLALRRERGRPGRAALPRADDHDALGRARVRAGHRRRRDGEPHVLSLQERLAAWGRPRGGTRPPEALRGSR